MRNTAEKRRELVDLIEMALSEVSGAVHYGDDTEIIDWATTVLVTTAELVGTCTPNIMNK